MRLHQQQQHPLATLLPIRGQWSLANCQGDLQRTINQMKLDKLRRLFHLNRWGFEIILKGIQKVCNRV